MQYDGMPILRRTLITEASVDAEIEAQLKLTPRAEDLWEGWVWRLAHDPFTDSLEITLDGLRLIKSDPQNQIYGLPTLTILYRCDDKHVTVVKVRFT